MLAAGWKLGSSLFLALTLRGKRRGGTFPPPPFRSHPAPPLATRTMDLIPPHSPVPDFQTSGRLALFLPSLRAGGAERNMLTLLGAMVAGGFEVDLVLAKAEGAFLDEVPQEVRLFDLGAPRMRQALPRLAFYLRRERPRAILSRMFHTNLASIIARMLSGVRTRGVIIEASTMSAEAAVQPRAARIGAADAAALSAGRCDRGRFDRRGSRSGARIAAAAWSRRSH